MKPPPLFIMAQSLSIARHFVEIDLRDDPRRLKFIQRPEDLLKQQMMVVIVHPTASNHPNFSEFMEIIKVRGYYTMTFSDGYARQAYHLRFEPTHSREHTPCPLSFITATARAKTSLSPATTPRSRKPR